MALLLLFNTLDTFKDSIVVLHYDHMLRENAYKDRIFVKKLAKKLDLPILIGRSDVGLFSHKNHFSPEEGARISRYQFFDHAAKVMNLNFIATAHTADDQIETVLWRLIRGSGIKGLAGIHSMRGIYARPVLSFEKAELIRFLKENKQNYRIDESNRDIRFKRNYIRANIVPLMKNMNPGLSSTIYKSSKQINMDNEFLDKETTKLSKQFVHRAGFYEIKRDNFIDFDKALQFRLISYFFILLSGGFNNLPLHFSEDALSVINAGNGTAIYRGFRMVVSCGYIALYMDYGLQKIDSVLNIGENTKISGMDIKVSRYDKHCTYESYSYRENEFAFYIDPSSIRGDLKLQNIHHGDYFVPFGKHRKVKVARFLIKNRIPIYFRRYVAVLSDDEKIVAVLPIQIDNRVGVNDNPKDILKIKCVIRSI